MTRNNQMEIKLSVQLQGVEDGCKTPEIAAYAFDSNANLLATAQISKGIATLNAPAPDNTDQLRILVGPVSDNQQADYSDLIRRGANMQRLRIDPKLLKHNLDVVLFPPDWLCWLRSACTVKGNLHKRVLVGGTYVNYPVCNATIEVYEVDPLWIIVPRLPLDILDKFRDIILNPKLPDPLPDYTPPIPLPDPQPGPAPLPFSNLGMSANEIQNLKRASRESISLISNTSNLRYAAQSASNQLLQQALIENPIIFRPLLCLYFPGYVTMQRVTTAKTDDCGKFNALFFRGCNNPDQPDLYFKAKQRLFGFLNITIYAPKPVSCNTWWNYNCGTEVNLFTSNPWTQTCSPCPPITGPNGANHWVAFMSIGAIGLNNIRGTSVDLQPTTNGSNLGLTQNSAPWGGTLLPRLEFSNSLASTGAVYYQLSWRKGNTGAFIPMTGTVNHYYKHTVTNSSGVSLPVWSPFNLGPKDVDDGAGNTVPYMYLIPYPSLAPVGVWDVPPNISEIKEHFANGKLFTKDDVPGITYSSTGAVQGTDVSGIYQIKVELFDKDGQLIDIAARNIVYAVPMDPDSSGTIQSVNANTLGLVHDNSMIINLHVNNNPCFASIDAPVIGSTSADNCCGVLNYATKSNNVTMAWKAFHPNNFARYTFRVVRGTRTVISDNDSVASSNSPLTRTVDHMMNNNLPTGCATNGCTVAGFSENLHVDALATNGWGRLRYLDANAVRAFVLAEQETETS